jgi:23S rRNA pseudouridine1911/1915/1917 synthase
MVILKPPGWLAQADGSERPDVLDWAKNEIRLSRPDCLRPYVGLCHRLDRLAAGLMVLAKTSKAAGRISRQFRERTVTKTYLALVGGQPKFPGPEEEGELLEQTLFRDGRLTKVRTDSAARPEETRCAIRCSRLKSGRVGEHQATLLKVDLLTGFKHQIRCQLASAGHPIVGDRLYGSPVESLERNIPGSDREWGIGLFAVSLTFKHPISGQEEIFEADPAPFWPWNVFK